MDIYMCSVRMYVHATHVQQPCLLSPSALFFFLCTMLLPWVVLPLCRPDLQKCRENGSGSKVTSARGGVPYRSALQRISSWRGSSLDRQTFCSVTPFRF